MMKFEDYSSWEAYLEVYERSEVSQGELSEFLKLMGSALKFYFDRHLQTLTPGIIEEFHTGEHPSQSHDRVTESEPFLKEITEFLSSECSLQIVDGPNISFYHMDLIVFDVTFDSEVSWSMVDREIPSFYKGFRVIRIRQSEADILND